MNFTSSIRKYRINYYLYLRIKDATIFDFAISYFQLTAYLECKIGNVPN